MHGVGNSTWYCGFQTRCDTCHKFPHHNLATLTASLLILQCCDLVNKVKAHSHEDEITNETSNDELWRDVGPHCCSRLTFRQDPTLLDPNENVWNTSGSHWTIIKTNSSHWVPTNSPYYYIIIINNIYY